MTGGKVVSSTVQVSVDPLTAFRVFTEELDLWWVRGPINFFDAGRVVEMRCEAGVGGRIGEVLDDREAGELVAKAEITAWEPGRRLAWTSVIDDVLTEVRFDPIGDGTRVTVEHRIDEGGDDRGGTAWSRVVPAWFGSWCARRDQVPHEPVDIAKLGLALYYSKPAAAARWLAATFQLEPAGDLPEGDDPLSEGEHGPPWIELRAGNASLIVFRAESEATGGPTHEPWVYVDDLPGHLEHAEANGAKIVRRLGWGWLPSYSALDIEGRSWTFAQARPTQR
jgi:hypothetical protein